MPSKVSVVCLVALGVVAGVGWTLALSPRIATAQSASGSWQVVADVHAYPAPGAWRVNTLTGEVRYCTNAGGWICIKTTEYDGR
jgi:hypothetical protein